MKNKVQCRNCINFEEFSDDDDYGPTFVCLKEHEIDHTGFSWELNYFPVDGECEDFKGINE